ncbi:glycosyltransferase [Anaerocolumna sp.]|uniref:glycosyltransferase n=1 Tax=Anaerocolumna sp. TaxID=2041569 RepID=UPI0028ADC507|nr:glycosyltransferase [Anaerocolumna sp.]
MVTISLCMIVKNEEQTIGRCLNLFASIVDEIIIVDTGSTDRTKEICLDYTNKVFDFDWIDDFSAARNYAYSFATMDYIMWVDADDVILVEDLQKFMDLKHTLDTYVDVVMMKYNTGLDIRGNSTFSFYRERLTKRKNNYTWKEPVHEYLEIFGNIKHCDISITHGKIHKERDNLRNIKIYEAQIHNNIPLTTRGHYYYARELKGLDRYEDAITHFEIFLEGNKGWKEDNIAACQELAKCYIEVENRIKALETLFRSFIYDLPRAETCCLIGYYYQDMEDYKRSLFWFEFILTLQKSDDILGFVQHDCWDYTPFIECAVCYDKLGDYEKAEYYNNKALEIKPQSAQALLNKKYFEEKNKLRKED